MGIVQDAITLAMERHPVPPIGFGNAYHRIKEHYAYEVTVGALLNLGWDLEDAGYSASRHAGCIRCRIDACLREGSGRRWT